mmetsp:Transcript_33023/g.56049  ORF Transcript_33023/g.56049 Transcript_33023/m.56049 type:complete len:716 (+) Transcript_33023:121-2268(+)
MGMNLDTGGLMAVKEIPLLPDSNETGENDSLIHDVEQEVLLLRQLKHPNIVAYLGTGRAKDALFVYMEYVPGGSISKLLKRFGRFNEHLVRVYTRQILEGVECLHRYGIMHRDIKGANILVDKNGTCKVSDFGAARSLRQIRFSEGPPSLKGTPYWMAPEVIRQTGHGRQADIWSIGCTVIEMLTGRPPWNKFKEITAALYHIAHTDEMPDMPSYASAAASTLIHACLQREPRSRPNATHLLNHFEFVATPPPQSSKSNSPKTSAAVPIPNNHNDNNNKNGAHVVPLAAGGRSSGISSPSPKNHSTSLHLLNLRQHHQETRVITPSGAARKQLPLAERRGFPKPRSLKRPSPPSAPSSIIRAPADSGERGVLYPTSASGDSASSQGGMVLRAFHPSSSTYQQRQQMLQLHKQHLSPESREQQELDVYHVDYSPQIEDTPVVPWGDPLPSTGPKSNTGCDSSHHDGLNTKNERKQRQIVGGDMEVDNVHGFSSGTDRGSLSSSTMSMVTTKNNDSIEDESIIGDIGKEAHKIMIANVPKIDREIMPRRTDNHNVNDTLHELKERKGKKGGTLCSGSVGSEFPLGSPDSYSHCGRQESPLHCTPITTSMNETARKTTRSEMAKKISNSQHTAAARGMVNTKEITILPGSPITSRLDTKVNKSKDPATGAMIKDYLVRHAKLSFPLDRNVSTNESAVFPSIENDPKSIAVARQNSSTR